LCEYQEEKVIREAGGNGIGSTRTGWTGVRVALLLALPFLMLGSSALAATSSAATHNVQPSITGPALDAAEAKRKDLFKRMLADPSNVDLALQYADLSAQVGDLEGAISTLERLLIFAPKVAQLNYELGVLYWRLGAYEQAAANFKAAAAAPDATPEMKTQAAAYIAAADKQVAGDFTTGNFTVGARYQTNANGGVQSANVSLNGVPFQVNDAAKAAPDANGFLATNIHASKDLAAQGDRFDFDLNLYGALQRTQGDLNTLAGEVQVGPVYNLERYSIKDATLGIYGILSGVALGGAPYLYTLGAGTVLTNNPGPTTVLHSRLEYRYETYVNSTARPAVSTTTGGRTRLTEDASVRANDWLSFYGSIYGERKGAQSALLADWEGGASVGTTLSLGGGDQKRPVTIDLSAGLTGRIFDAPDPVFSTSRRIDRAGYVQGVVSLPLGDSVSAVATANYSKQISNYDLHTFDDLSVSLALSKGF